MSPESAQASLMPSVVTWVLVVAGWLIVSEQHRFREQQKNVHARLLAMRELLTQIEDDAIAFYTSAYSEASLQKILRQIKRLSNEFNSLKRRKLVSMSVHHAITELRQSVSGDASNASKHQIVNADSGILTRIHVAKSDLDESFLAESNSALMIQRGVIEAVRSIFSNI